MSSSPPDTGPEARSASSPLSAITGFARGLSRRVRTLIVSGVLFIVLLVLALTLPVPYVILTPGPTCNTLASASDCTNGQETEQIIAIDGRRPNPTTGNLNLTTISYTNSPITVFNALSAWLQGDQVVVPKSYIIPPGQTTQQVNESNSADFQQSQENAVIAASCLLGFPKRFGILSVVAGGPSDKILQPDDALVSVDGHPVSTFDELRKVLDAETPGTAVPVVIERDGAQRTVRITLGQPDEGASGASMGIGVTSSPECLAPFEIDLGLGDQIGGPSAGLMFTLGIIAKVGDPHRYDVTQGRFIAGTGTIDPQGNVGPIGGIQLKMIAARRAGATLFLAPAGNCGDVDGAIPSGLQVVKVSNLRQAVRDLLVPANQASTLPGC